jgi:hypothetical protein
MKNETWEFIKLSRRRITISNKWVFQINRKTNNEVDQYHARLVAKGFFQTKGIDFHKAFAIVAKLPSIKIMLGVVTQVEGTTSVMFD